MVSHYVQFQVPGTPARLSPHPALGDMRKTGHSCFVLGVLVSLDPSPGEQLLHPEDLVGWEVFGIPRSPRLQIIADFAAEHNKATHPRAGAENHPGFPEAPHTPVILAMILERKRLIPTSE